MPRLSKIGAAALAAFGWTGLQSVDASYLVVAGGGGGGSRRSAGGGGAGGYLDRNIFFKPNPVIHSHCWCWRWRHQQQPMAANGQILLFQHYFNWRW
jgi:hypothetical protein